MNGVLASPNWNFHCNHVWGFPNTRLTKESYNDILVQYQIDAYTEEIRKMFQIYLDAREWSHKSSGPAILKRAFIPQSRRSRPPLNTENNW